MSDFELEEATVEGMGAAMRAGDVSCRELVEAYLARIEAYDRQGPTLNAVVTVNPDALDQASAVDAELRSGSDHGPMHGIPVLVKDQVETAGLTTTYGCKAFQDRVPDTDATAVTWLREAGAIVLAKTVLPDFAVSWFGFSSSGGETKNPYSLAHDPGGSSSGTGAGVAANLGAVGIGEDTGGSIRVPASFCNLVGLRPTVGLVPRTGMSPLVTTQDTAGPMARTVADAAILLDVLAGYDPLDPYTSLHAWAGIPEEGYFAALAGATLQGARIGVLRSAFGSDDDPESGPVNRAIGGALEGLAAAGATIVDDLTVDALDELIVTTSLYTVQSKRDIDAFLAARGLAPAHVVDIVAQGLYHPACDLIEAIAEGPEDPTTDPSYFAGVAARFDFARAIMNLMAKHDLDALAFPDVQVTPPAKADVLAGKWNTLTYPTNTLIASQTSLPGISVPAGLTDDGLPIGMELIGPPLSEAHLLRLAAAFEQETRFRVVPAATPALNGH